MGRSDLAKAFDAALAQAGYAGAGCMRCGGLSPRSLSILVVEDGFEPARCEGCGLVLDGDGRAVGMRMFDGSVRSTLIVLCASPPIAVEGADRGSD